MECGEEEEEEEEEGSEEPGKEANSSYWGIPNDYYPTKTKGLFER